MSTTDHEALDQKPAIQTITFGIGTCTLGLALVAATSRGICAILLGSNEKALAGQLRSIFLHAILRKSGKEFEETLNQVVEYIEMPTGAVALPLYIRGTAFQKRVWNVLEEIPAGQTVSSQRRAQPCADQCKRSGHLRQIGHENLRVRNGVRGSFRRPTVCH